MVQFPTEDEPARPVVSNLLERAHTRSEFPSRLYAREGEVLRVL